MKKKLLMVVIIWMLMLTHFTTETYAAGTYTANTVTASLNSLMNQYVGTTWNRSFAGGSQCYAFAHYVFDTIFGRGSAQVGNGAVSSNSTCYKLNNVAADIITIGTLTPGYTSIQLEQLLESAAPGDYIQVKRRTSGGPHSMIVVSVDTSSNTIEIFDANTDGKGVVKRYKQTFAEFINKNIGVSIYRYKNYTYENINHHPGGVFDLAEGRANAVFVRGWALDNDYKTEAIEIHVYIGGPAGSGAQGTSILANTLREDVGNEYPGVGNYHGFNHEIHTTLTGQQTVYVYAINKGAGENQFIGSKTVNILKDTTPPAITNARISAVTNSTYTVTCNVSDGSGAGIEWVKFPSWHSSKSGGDAIWYNGSVSNGVATCVIPITELGNTSGIYHTHIYAQDKAGNQNCVAVSAEIDAAKPSDMEYVNIGTGFVAHIENMVVQKVLTAESNDNVVSRSYTGSNNQKWLFTRNSDGTYTIKSQANGKCLDNYAGSGTSNSNVGVYAGNDSDAQRWYIIPNQYGGYYFRPKCSTDCVLDLQNLDNSEGANIAIHTFNTSEAQRFIIIEEKKLAERSQANLGNSFYASIANSSVGKVLSANTSNVTSSTDSGSSKQRWKFTRNSDGTYTIQLKADGKYLYNGEGTNNSNVIVSGTAQKWSIYEAGDGSYYLKPSSSSNCVLDLSDFSSADGANIAIHEFNSTRAQRYTIKKDKVTVTGISLNASTAVLAAKGGTKQLTATVLPAEATDKSVIWSSSNTRVATVNTGGLVTAVGNGTATITAKTVDGAKTATCQVTVSIPVPVTGVGMDKSELLFDAKGEKQSLACLVIPADATNKNVTWISSNTSVATVSTNGEVTAVGNGTAKITVTTSDGKKTATCNVIVQIPVPVTSIALNHTSVKFTETGATKDMEATISPSDASNQLVGWSSSNTSVAIVDEEGTVTAVGEGTAVITAITEDGGKTASCTVTVTIPVKVSGVSLDKSQINFTEIGSSQQLTVTVSPSNATNKTVTWSSNDNSIASVSSSGLVTAEGEGTTVITAITEDGSRVATCIVSVQRESEHTHSYSKTVTKVPACKSAGTAVHTCIECGDSYAETIPATGHIGEMIVKFAKEPTCSMEGYSGDTYCVDCGELILEGKILETTEHSWGEGIVTTEATCKAEGIITFTCIACGADESYSTGKAAHSAVTDNAVQADCKNDGKTEGIHCSVCQEVMKAQITIPKLDHQWDAGRVTKEPTCTADGEKTYYCSVCGDNKVEKTGRSVHTVVVDVAIAAGCATDGKTEGSHCGICGEIITAQTVITAIGHKWDNGYVTKGATCIAEGEKSFTCLVCGMKKTEATAKSEHTMIKDSAIAAGCTTTGKTEGSHCSVCGMVSSAQSVTSATGHQWDAGRITAEAGIFTAGVKIYTCTMCGTTETEAIPAVGGPAIGTQFKDNKSSAYYQITKADAEGTTVAYVRSAKKNKVKTITVPTSVTWNGITYKVTEIAPNAFKNDKKLEKLVVGNNVEKIGASASYGCKKLTKVTLGKNVKSIEKQSFRNCTAITSITIPAKIETIGKQAFQGCKKLKNLTVKSQMLTSKSVGSKAFSGIYTKAVVKVPKAKVKEYKKLLKTKGISTKAVVKK